MNLSKILGNLLLGCTLFLSHASFSAEKFEFRDGDRIILLGNTLIEREGNFGYIETLLTRHFPQKNLTFRNLGYSAESVSGDSRAMFDTAKEGFQRMVNQVAEASPTVIFIGFGQNAAYEGEEGLQGFMDGYRNLVEILEASNEARFVVLSPPALEKLAAPLPDPAEQNGRVEKYVEAIQAFATEKEFFFIDLYRPLLVAYGGDADRNWTDNTIHFNPYGYWRLSFILAEAIGLEERDWKAILDLEKFQIDGAGVRFDSIHYDEKGGLQLLLTDRTVPIPNPPVGSRGDFEGVLPSRTLWVSGLPEKTYDLFIDENTVGTFSSTDLDEGVEFPLGLRGDQAERLRKQIKEKSQLFFYRWRPQNWTYLYGFRKYEQGQNAKETPMFDPLIADLEEEISQTKTPVTYRVEIVPAKGGVN